MQVTKVPWCVCEQCVSASFFSSPAQEPVYEATVNTSGGNGWIQKVYC